MERQDVDEIVNACDAGREGELIFRNLIKLAGKRKVLDMRCSRSFVLGILMVHPLISRSRIMPERKAQTRERLRRA
jgi:hypothetical protein